MSPVFSCPKDVGRKIPQGGQRPPACRHGSPDGLEGAILAEPWRRPLVQNRQAPAPSRHTVRAFHMCHDGHRGSATRRQGEPSPSRRAVPVPCLPVETKSNGPLRPPKARQKAPFFRRSGEFSGPRCERKRVPKASRSESSRPDASDHVFHDENRPGDQSLDLLFALGLTLGEISSDRRRPFRSGTPIGASSSLHRD